MRIWLPALLPDLLPPAPHDYHWYSPSSLAAGSKFLGSSLRWLLGPAASVAASAAAVLAAAASRGCCSRGCRCLLPSPLHSCSPGGDRRGPLAPLAARHCRRAVAGSRAGWVRVVCIVEYLLITGGNILSKEERGLKEHFIASQVGTCEWHQAVAASLDSDGLSPAVQCRKDVGGMDGVQWLPAVVLSWGFRRAGQHWDSAARFIVCAKLFTRPDRIWHPESHGYRRATFPLGLPAPRGVLGASNRLF